MKLLLYNTASGLKPMYDEDFDEKKKLKLGCVYECEIKLKRNVRFLRKYFSLIRCAWEYLPESQTAGFGTVELFRKWVEIQAGNCDILQTKTETYKLPRSISFEKMDEAEFSDLYERVKDVIWKLIGRYVSEEEFERNLSNY